MSNSAANRWLASQQCECRCRQNDHLSMHNQRKHNARQVVSHHPRHPTKILSHPVDGAAATAYRANARPAHELGEAQNLRRCAGLLEAQPRETRLTHRCGCCQNHSKPRALRNHRKQQLSALDRELDARQDLPICACEADPLDAPRRLLVHRRVALPRQRWRRSRNCPFQSCRVRSRPLLQRRHEEQASKRHRRSPCYRDRYHRSHRQTRPPYYRHR